MSPKKLSSVSSCDKSFSGPVKAAASDAGISGKRTYSKASSRIAQMPRKHVAMTAPILSYLRPFTSQVSGPVSLKKRIAPHVTEIKNRTEDITETV